MTHLDFITKDLGRRPVNEGLVLVYTVDHKSSSYTGEENGD